MVQPPLQKYNFGASSQKLYKGRYQFFWHLPISLNFLLFLIYFVEDCKC